MGILGDLFSSRSRRSESSFLTPHDRVQNDQGFFSYFDFSKTEEKELYLLCATRESADQPVLVKIKCRCEIREVRYWTHIFSCVVTEIEAEPIKETKENLAESMSNCPITPESQLSTLRKALAYAQIEGNPIRVSQNYMDHHLKIARIRKEIQARKERKEAQDVHS